MCYRNASGYLHGRRRSKKKKRKAKEQQTMTGRSKHTKYGAGSHHVFTRSIHQPAGAGTGEGRLDSRKKKKKRGGPTGGGGRGRGGRGEGRPRRDQDEAYREGNGDGWKHPDVKLQFRRGVHLAYHASMKDISSETKHCRDRPTRGESYSIRRQVCCLVHCLPQQNPSFCCCSTEMLSTSLCLCCHSLTKSVESSTK